MNYYQETAIYPSWKQTSLLVSLLLQGIFNTITCPNQADICYSGSFQE